MRVTCKSCGAVHPIAPPPWVVSSGRPFRMVCSRCGAAQEVVPTGLAVLDDLLPEPDPGEVPGPPPRFAPDTEPPPLAMPVVTRPPPSARSGIADDLEADRFLEALLHDVDGDRGTILPSDTHVDPEISGTFDAMPDTVVRPSAVGRFLLRQGGEEFQVSDLATLQRWIVERRLEPTDALSEDGGSWHEAGSRPDLAVFFATVRQLDAAARAAPEPPRPSPAPPVPVARPVTPPPAASAPRRGKQDTLESEPRVPADLGPPADDEFEEPTVPHIVRPSPHRNAEVTEQVIPPRPRRRDAPAGTVLVLSAVVGLASLLGIFAARQRDAAHTPTVPPPVEQQVVVAPVVPTTVVPSTPSRPKTSTARSAAPPVVDAALEVKAPVAPKATAAPKPAATATPVPGTPTEPAEESVRARVEPAPKADVRASPTIPAGADVGTLVRVGWEAVDVNDLALAFQAFEQAIGQDPEDVGANYGIGYILLQRGRLSQARAYLCRALPGATGSDEHELERLMADHGISCRTP